MRRNQTEEKKLKTSVKSPALMKVIVGVGLKSVYGVEYIFRLIEGFSVLYLAKRRNLEWAL